MSEEVKPFTMIPNELFEVGLSSLEFRFLVNFIKISKKFNGHSFFGYTELAKANYCGKAAAIKTVKSLQKMGFIEVSSRRNNSQSNDIYLTLNKGFSMCQNGGFGTSNKGYLKDTPSTDEGYLKDTPGYLKDTPHIDLKNKIIKNKIIKKDEGYLKDTPRTEKVAAGSQKATADVAAVRSIANDESAREVTAESQCDLEDFVLVSSFKERFLRYLPNIQLLKIGNDWAVRPYPYFQGNFDKIAGDFCVFFAEKSVHFALLKASTRRAGEIIMNI